ncbi:YcaO-like family protein [Heyndrickxia acidicola]|uniref:YcaO-like family protein n=1 Tax=Heyndrickxia acidicola TaxID=209389 RepID=UPI00082425A4|nr:YcaO-like family protein [Heyndrickxia acidicola]
MEWSYLEKLKSIVINFVMLNKDLDIVIQDGNLYYKNNVIYIKESFDKVEFTVKSCTLPKVKDDYPKIIIKINESTNLIKHFMYFLMNIKRIGLMVLQKENVTFYFNYNDSKGNNIKTDKTIKRIKTNGSLFNDLNETLIFLGEGCIISENNGSATVVNRGDSNIEGFGYDFNEEDASLKAKLEYLERYAASLKLEETISDCYTNISKSAINPIKLGVYSNSQCIQQNLSIYSNSLVIDWVKGQSLVSGEYLLIPEQYVQYLVPNIKNRFIYESSNGCAVGNTFEEASLFSILEVVERDVFMNFWFSKDKATRIDINVEPKLSKKVQYFNDLGYTLDFFYINNGLNIHVVWGLLRSNNIHNYFYSITGLGCHLKLQHAIEAAFKEIYNVFIGFEKNKFLIEKKIQSIKSGIISNLEDHLYYFASFDSMEIIEDKINILENVDVDDLKINNFMSIDISDELQYVVKNLSKKYTDILIVDQTNNYLKAFSLNCTKAILIGSAPLDFTSDLIRLQNNEVTNVRKAYRNIHPLA